MCFCMRSFTYGKAMAVMEKKKKDFRHVINTGGRPIFITLSVFLSISLLLALVLVFINRENTLVFIFSLLAAVVVFGCWLLLTVYRIKATKIRDVAFIDNVTGAWNRNYFDLEAEKMIKAAPPGTYAFITHDIEDFALINQFYGVNVGNETLSFFAKIFGSCVSEDELFCRHTNDIFNALVKVCDRDQIEKAYKKFSDELATFSESKFSRRNSMQFFLKAKIGIYKIDNPNESILKIRDKANMAKKAKDGVIVLDHLTYSFYSDYAMNERRHRKDVENRMEAALTDGQFQPYFQPKLDLKTGTVVGAEALVRWVDPKNGVVPPSDFIPVFEENGFVKRIDLFIFDKACECIKNWINKGCTPVKISTNFSRLHLEDDDFVAKLVEIKDHYGIPSEYLEIELTETVIFSDLERTNEMASKAHKAGLSCSIDDFGNGYSSLNMLSDMKADTIKLDRAFFGRNKELGNRRESVIRAMISLGHELGQTIVAEGVEHSEHMAFLKSVGCDQVQGYYVAKPMPLSDFESKYIH